MKILLAEDSLTMMLTTTAIINKSGHEVIQARDGKEALTLYFSENPDLVLLDVEMPEYNGFQVAEKIRSKNKEKWVPIIFLTGFVDDNNLARGINAGGDDYLTKPVSSLVLNAKLNAMNRISEMQTKLLTLTTELSEMNNKLQKSVVTDPLTGCKNRLYLDECIKREWYRCRRNKSNLSILLVDVDNFKTLNDTNGHQAGDECLIKLVELFNSHLKRSTDELCRYGGDEFVIVLPDTSEDNSMNIAENIRASVFEFNQHFELKIPVSISVSIGSASYQPDDEITSDEFLTFADKALYAAKDAGRNCVVKAEIPSAENIAA
jgi:diguanylate cyclase (GGDEF)-like protein